MEVADLYGIRACLLDGGEIRGAGNAWICPEVLLLCSFLHFHSVTPVCLIESDLTSFYFYYNGFSCHQISIADEIMRTK